MYLDSVSRPSRIQIPDSFKGLDPDLEVSQYARHLPHYRQKGATYFLTFRLIDALPKSVLEELKEREAIWRRRLAQLTQDNPDYASAQEAYAQHRLEQTIRENDALDEGMGACVMSSPSIRRIVDEALLHFHSVRMELYAFVTMPNHVHALFRPFEGYEPERLAGSWKAHTGRVIHQQLNTQGPLWQEESWDRIVRDAEHFRRVVRYIARNPTKARISREHASVWINPLLLSSEQDGMVQEEIGGYDVFPY
jgi:putative transposase